MGKLRKPTIQSDRRKQGNTHGKIDPKVIILHSTESHDRPGITDVAGVQIYLENTEDQLGIHFVVDKVGNVGQSANTNDLVYHARGANSFAIGIEMIGFAKFSLKQWYLRRKQLHKVAKLLAWASKKHGIPLERSTTHGIALHRDYPAGGHWDPGYNFPINRVLKIAAKYRVNGW